MELLQPTMLWGLIGLSIPILIHLWNGRKGRTVSWAAMQWLEVKENKPVKSLQLEHWLLLILRILLLLILVLILANLYLKMLEEPPGNPIVHLVEPSAHIMEEYRFELQQAMDRGEPVYWLDNEFSPVTSLSDAASKPREQEIDLQEVLNRFRENQTHLYLINSSRTFGDPLYFVSSKPLIFLSQPKTFELSSKAIQLKDNKYLTLNDLNQLEVVEDLTNSEMEIVWNKGELRYFVNMDTEIYREEIEAALKAIETVYELDFELSQNQEEAFVIFGMSPPQRPDNEKLYVCFFKNRFSRFANVVYLDFPEEEATESFANKGRLPEEILERLVLGMGLDPQPVALGEAQIGSKFIEVEPVEEEKQANTLEILWLLFVLTLIPERILSTRKQL